MRDIHCLECHKTLTIHPSVHPSIRPS